MQIRLHLCTRHLVTHQHSHCAVYNKSLYGTHRSCAAAQGLDSRRSLHASQDRRRLPSASAAPCAVALSPASAGALCEGELGGRGGRLECGTPFTTCPPPLEDAYASSCSASCNGGCQKA